MNFDRSKQTLKATRDFARADLSKKAGEALTKREMSRLDDAGIQHLVGVAGVAEPVGLDTQAAKDAEAAEAKADKDAADRAAAQGSTPAETPVDQVQVKGKPATETK